MTQIIRRLILAFALMAGIAPAIAQVPPPVPALPDTERRTTYGISGSLCTCAVGFQLYGDSTDYTNWLEVWVNGALITQAGNWTLTSPTGSLATIPRPITDAVLTFTAAQTGTVQIVGARRPRRTSQFSENRGVAARDLNQVLSDLTAQNRETWDKTNDITGRVPRVPPGETLAMLPALTARANQGACFSSLGNLTSCVTVPGSSFAAGLGITFTGTNPTTISTPTYSAGIGVQFTGTNPTVISVSQTTGAPVIPSRAAAATQDLSSYTVVRTLGYAVGGDGGGATFIKVGAVPFKDTYATTGTVAPGSGYTNNTYLGVRMTGGSGQGCMAKVTIAGAVMTAVDITGGYCAAYAVGDVLTPFNADVGGTGSGATFTITAVTTAAGSFSDTAANKWQIVTDAESFPNVRQFGAKIDWAGNDATATNDLASFQSAIAFASINNGSAASFVTGGKIFVPKGAALLCAAGTPFATLQVPQGVNLQGAGVSGGTELKQCDAAGGTVHFIALCDPNAQFGQFGCKLEDMTVYAPAVSAGSTVAIYSNSGQQFPLINNVFIVTSTRGCIKYEIGKGGASNAIFENFDCEQSSTGSNNAGAVLDSSNTQFVIRNANFGCAPSTCVAGIYAIAKTQGNLIASGVHIEGHADGINFSGSSADLSVIRDVTITTGCVNGITLTAANPNNTVLVENIQSSCSTATVLNGHGSGTNATGNILAQRVFNP